MQMSPKHHHSVLMRAGEEREQGYAGEEKAVWPRRQRGRFEEADLED